MIYSKGQNLNSYVLMLDSIYGKTANYERSAYELINHLTEVTGAFGKYLFKRKQPDKAYEFLPKMFAWLLAVYSNVCYGENILEQVILNKYPKVCPYCLQAPCVCNNNEHKESIDQVAIKGLYFAADADKKHRSLDDFQSMFRSIYEPTWYNLVEPEKKSDGYAILNAIYIRLFEELSELSEALRFSRLYPFNFENELADYLAWWFAIVSTMHMVLGKDHPILSADSVIWPAYPGRCQVCMLSTCDCRPGPVREILSKPALKDLPSIDGLTQANNKDSFQKEMIAIHDGVTSLPIPIACIWIDIDDFGKINNKYDHYVGDDTLKYIVSTIRQKIRARDRLFRWGGDEFVILCPDFSVLEAQGMMQRVVSHMKQSPFIIKGADEQKDNIINVTLSIGITECHDIKTITRSFELADHASQLSKQAGKDRITIGGQ